MRFTTMGKRIMRRADAELYWKIRISLEPFRLLIWIIWRWLRDGLDDLL
jgi:hypothetical protein